MDGYGVEVDSAGNALAYGNGWYRELGRIEVDQVFGWRAIGVDGRDILEVGVNQRDLAVLALVREAGLGQDYVSRWSE